MSVPRLGYRHVVVLLNNFGLLLVYCMRVNLSVALIAMVGRNDTDEIRISDHTCDFRNSTKVKFIGKQFDWSRETEGLILSSFFWGYLLLQIPAGRLAQRNGGKWIFGGGVAATSALTMLTPVVAESSVYLLIVLRFFIGLCESVCYPTVLAMLGRWSPCEESTFLLSLSLTGGVIGTVVGQMMTGPICESETLGGWPAVFYFSGGAGLVWTIPWMVFIYDSPASHPHISEEEKNYIVQSTGGLQEDTNKRAIPWKRILTSRIIHVYIFCNFVSSWVKYTFLACLPQYLSDVLHLRLTTNAIVASLPYISYIFVSNGLSWLCETCVNRGWIGKTRMKRILTTISLVVCGACLFAITLVSDNSDLIITLLVVGYTFYGGLIPGLSSNALDLSPEYSGSIFALSNVISTITGILSPLVTDVITRDRTAAQWDIVFYISAAATAVAGIVYWLFGSSERQYWHLDVDLPGENEKFPLMMDSESCKDGK